MPNVEWSVAHDLVTPGGTVLFNQVEAAGGSSAGGRLWQLEHDSYAIVPTLRITTDNLSQANGSIIHPRFKTGLTATMKVTYMVKPTGADQPDYVPACGTDLREMHEALIRALDSITDLTSGTQRLIWTPDASPGIDRRMLDQVVVTGWPTAEWDITGTSATFAVESPFPYAIGYTQESTPLGATVVNDGTTEFTPVIKVNGPASAFTITSMTDLDQFGAPKEINYDSSRPDGVAIPGGHFAEIDTFRGSIYLDGNGADLTAGLDPETTDFWRLLPGSNVLTISGAGADMLWNQSYA